MFQLSLKNLFRWVKEYIISWGLLFFIYSITASVLLQAVFENIAKIHFEWYVLWPIVILGILVPGPAEIIPGSLLKRSFFGTLSIRAFCGPLGALYLSHEFRRAAPYFGIILVACCVFIVPEKYLAFWIILFQFSVQRSLYSVQKWRNLVSFRYPENGGIYLVYSFVLSQIICFSLTYGLASMFLYVVSRDGALIYPFDHWLKLGMASFGAIAAGAAVAMEGDSGRPWLVNVFSLAAGSFAGFLCLWTPWAFVAIGYLLLQIPKMVQRRLISVEVLDEDVVIS